MSDSEIAPKEDDAKIASDDKYVEGGKTQMGKISQNIFIWRPLKHPHKSWNFWSILIEEGLDLVLINLFVMR